MNLNDFLLVFAIYWSNIVVRNNGEVPDPLEIDIDEYNTISSRLRHSRSFQIFPEEQSKSYFDYSILHKKKSTSIDPEICEWGTAENDAIPVEICKNTAIQLATEITPLMKPSTGFFSPDLDFIPYKKCYKRLAKNGSIEVNGIYCPPSIIDIPAFDNTDTTTRIHLDGFLLGEGDREMNSAFVFHFDRENVQLVRILRYIFKLFVTPAIRIRINTYEDIIRRLSEMEFVLHDNQAKAVNRFKSYKNPCGYLQLCSGQQSDPSIYSYETKENMAPLFCKFLAILKFYKLGKHQSTVNFIYLNENTEESDYTDINGFVPYKYVNRKVNHKMIPLIGPKSEEEMIYCPVQLFTIEEEIWYRQQGFLYSAGDDNDNSAFLYQAQINMVDGQNVFDNIHVQSYVTWSNLDHLNDD